ncbi:hypothetical protein [Nonomuraea ceibae]|uniref:hypothetical protein n=1 Tax=Nonomuraea ceibae TaxID=1935170 RepID=UPI00355651D0
MTATAVRNGVRAETFSLTTATGQSRLAVTVEDTAPQNLFARIAIADTAGTVFTGTDRDVEIEITGPAELAALGSGNPAPRQTYGTARHATFDGRALAIVRRNGSGTVVRVTAEGCEPAEVTLDGGA